MLEIGKTLTFLLFLVNIYADIYTKESSRLVGKVINVSNGWKTTIVNVKKWFKSKRGRKSIESTEKRQYGIDKDKDKVKLK